MKLLNCLFVRNALLAPVFIASVCVVSAQNAERSAGINDPASGDTSRSHTVTQLVATLVTVGIGPELKRDVIFSTAGTDVKMSGRIEGLEPQKRYRLTIPNVTDASSPSSGIGALTQVSVSPHWGKPDGTKRVPVEEDEVASLNKPILDGAWAPVRVIALPVAAMAIVVADAQGIIELNTMLRGRQLAEGPNGLLGLSVKLTEVMEEASKSKPALIANGVIKLPEPRKSPSPFSSLDELEPGEVWF